MRSVVDSSASSGAAQTATSGTSRGAASSSSRAAWVRSGVLYDLLECGHRGIAAAGRSGRAGCVVIGVANAVGLVDRYLPALPVSLRPQRVAFAPYDAVSLEAVLRSRMERAWRLGRIGQAARHVASRLAARAASEAADSVTADSTPPPARHGRVRAGTAAARTAMPQAVLFRALDILAGSSATSPDSASSTGSGISSRLVHPGALKLCCKRIASASGDLRKATACLRAALVVALHRDGGSMTAVQDAASTCLAVESWQAQRQEHLASSSAHGKRSRSRDRTPASKTDRGSADKDAASKTDRGSADKDAASKTDRGSTDKDAGDVKPLVSVADMARAMRGAAASMSVAAEVRCLPVQAQALLVAAMRATSSKHSVSIADLRSAHSQLVREHLLSRVVSEDFFPLLERLKGAGLVAVAARGRRSGAAAMQQQVRVTTSREDCVSALKGTPLMACLE
jgi:Cdc6-like AAA superfamily ATPase